MPRILKWTALVIAAVFALAQLVRPARVNPPTGDALALPARSRMTPEVEGILRRACLDCHSNQTRWPWYSNVAPASWFVIDHVNHGRRHLNFSTWAERGRPERIELLEEINKTVRSGSMPLDSYTLLHPEARLSEQERAAICDWASAERERSLAEAGGDDGRKREARPSNN
ncbi:MAG TPA: heme-binding domain-containing protein [Blastocatellia bacterium]|nr:heme-binding domain-containing protein [Blastocatellia bacterium]